MLQAEVTQEYGDEEEEEEANDCTEGEIANCYMTEEHNKSGEDLSYDNEPHM
jgi:hypothetical protein